MNYPANKRPRSLKSDRRRTLAWQGRSRQSKALRCIVFSHLFEVELGPSSSRACSVSNFKEFATGVRAAVVFMAGLSFFVFFLDHLH